MKNKILLLTFIISTSSVIAQSKKEIIEILNTRIDSLNIEIKKRDVKYEQEAISYSKNNQTLTSQIKDLEDNLKSAKMDIDSIQKINIQLNEKNLNLSKELGTLKDSIYIFHSTLSSISANKTDNVAAGLGKIKSKWDYFMDEFTDVKYIVKDSLNKICNDERCVSFLLTNGFLVATYRINEVVEFDTQIIDLVSNQDLLSSSKSKIYVDGFDKEKNILLISSEGYDNNGRYWQYGTWGFNNKTLKLGKKEY
jgi:cell division protein FtsB